MPNLTYNDFASGKFDDYFSVLNHYSDSVSEYTPYTPHALSQSQYDKIMTSNAQLQFVVSDWQSNVGANDSTVIISTKDDNSQSTKDRKEQLKNRIYKIIYTEQGWYEIQKQVIKYIAKEGNAVLLLNDEGKIIVESIFRFNVYWDNQNKRARYAYKVKGVEVEGMKNLKHGVELFHIKDPVFCEYPVAPSRIDAALAFLLLENKGIKLNIHLFAKGWFSNILLKLNSDILPKLQDERKDDQGKTWWEKFLDNLNARFSGVEKAGRVGYVPGLEGIFEIGKSNKDTQFMEMIKNLTPERIAWAYSMTLTDFGAGNNTTYNNATTFDYALYDKVGRDLEKALDKIRNDFLLKKLGVITNEKFYIKYNEPQNPNKLEEAKQWREDWINNAITLNEYREMRGLPPLEGGDVVMSQYNSLSSTQPNTIDVEQVNNSLEHKHHHHFNKALEFADKKTRIEKELESEDTAKFLARWEKAIKKQCNQVLEDIKDLKDEDLKDYNAKLPKIETYYAFNVLKKDLLVFVGKALDELQKDSKIKFNKQFFDGEYPKSILDAIEMRTEMLLKGLGDYKGVDETTTQQINKFIADNAIDGVVELAQKLSEFIPELSFNRAEAIAHTEVANALEGTRFTMYKENGAVKKKLRTVKDRRVRSTHKEAEELGWVDIDFDYGGFVRGGEEFRCRCDTDYQFSDENG